MKLGLFLTVATLTAGKHTRIRDSSSVSLEDKSSEVYKGYESVPSFAEESGFGPIELDLNGELRRSFALSVALHQPSRNIICSPLSALFPLGKLALGAGRRGQKELIQAIGYEKRSLKKKFKRLIKDLTNLPGVELTVASKIFVGMNRNIKREFSSKAKAIFGSSIKKLDFTSPVEAAHLINSWVKKETKGLIPSIMSPDSVSADISIILVNAIYFKGLWQHPFSHVTLEKFYSSTRSNNKVHMMKNSAMYNYAKSDLIHAQLIEIPYVNEEVSLLVILPYEKDGLKMLLNQLKVVPEALNKALKQMRKTAVKLSLPKFKINTRIDLKHVCGKIGVNRIFDPNDSDLTEIFKDNDAHFVSDAVQSAVIDVNEYGTEAAAATAVSIVATAGYLSPEVFKADHPFLFYIIAKKQQLFAGIFTNKR